MPRSEVRVAEEPRSSRQQAARIVREARNRAGYSQARLGESVGVSRYTINRIEAGTQDLPADLAAELSKVLGEPTLVELFDEDDDDSRDLPLIGSYTRDALLDSLLSAPGPDRLVILLVDDLDVVSLLTRHRLNLPPTVDVVYPTKARQEQLRGKTPGYQGLWDVQRDINRLFAAVTPGGPLNPSDAELLDTEIRVYDSDFLHQSLVVVGSSVGISCVTWPFIPGSGGHNSESVPALASTDPVFLRRVEDHVDGVIRGRQPLTHLKVVAVVEDADDDADTEPVHRLSTFFTLGSDVEDAFVRTKPQPASTRSGFAVGLVLAHGIIGRPGHPLGRRVLLRWDDETKSNQLFSAHLSDEDVRDRTLGTERSTFSDSAAIKAFHRANPTSRIHPDAFRRAAVRAIMHQCGVDVEESHLHEVALPTPLWAVDKSGQDGKQRLPIIPALFALDLTPADADWDYVSSLIRTAKCTPLGRADFDDAGVPVNDFLNQVITNHLDWWHSLFEKLEIAWS